MRRHCWMRLDASRTLPGMLPSLWKVLGPDGSLFGYAYTPLIRLNIVVVNENTIRRVSF